MKKSVHNNNFKLTAQSLLTAITGIRAYSKQACLVAFGVVFTLAALAQSSYTTKADGNWSSPSTWVGGVVPGATIAAGKTVYIKHKVTFDLNSDLAISGTLNITADTLQFNSSFGKDIQVNAGGLLYVNNGFILQDISTHKSNLQVDGGRVWFINSIVYVSKSFLLTNGGSRSYKNSKIYIGNKYELGGTSSAAGIDSIQNSLVEMAMSENGDFRINNYGILRVANADVLVDNGNDFINTNGGSISVISGASSNYGFDWLKITHDLQNDGAWNGRIDAACIANNIKGSQMADIDFTRAQDCSSNPEVGDAPELVFKNPVLKSGKANSEGALYRFSNVISGVDAEIKMKKFSRKDIVMQAFDLSGMGWDKAFQPQFGLPGLVQPNQNWYIDFELKFYESGTNKSIKVPKVDLTALDVDGDGLSVREYAVFQNPANTIYSTISYLTGQAAGIVGQTFTCSLDGLTSALITCPVCGGDGKTGLWNLTDCTSCDATGLLYSGCNHAYDGTSGNVLQGPVENFMNIDTAATQVMATYQYNDVNFIAFRYGAQSGAVASNGAGIRLNSLWFRDFNLAPPSVLPVKLSAFSATLAKKDVSLNWTGNEENFSHYVVQRSTDGKNFSDIAVVFANNAGSSTYAYKDASVSSPTNMVFYRLLMVDNAKEGGVYSEARVVRLSKEEGDLQLSTYPNPVANQLRVTLPASWQGKAVTLELYSANGIRMQGIQLGSASQTETVQVGQLSKGFYLVKATCENQVAQQRIVKN
jgi:hypothetical protein